MKIRTKKIIKSTCISLSILSLITWYLFPYFTHKLWSLTYNDKDILQYLEMKPTHIEKLHIAPEEWHEVKFGELSFKIPTSKSDKIRGDKNHVVFRCESGIIIIDNIAPTKAMLKRIEKKEIDYPPISYSQRLEVFTSTPSDISLFNTRQSNQQAFYNQILKSMSFPYASFNENEINIINTTKLKAICEKSKGEKGYSAWIEIYSRNEAMTFSISLLRYQDKDSFNNDILAILGGMEVPDHRLDIEVVDRDIKAIFEQLNASI